MVGLLASLFALTACSQHAGRPASTSDANPQVVRRLTPREGVHYFEEGVHAAAETSVAVGVLRYRSITATDGTWILISKESPAVLAAEARPFAALTGSPGFDKDFWPLDGQYVAVEGSVTGESDRVTEMRVEALSLVSDIFPMKTDTICTPGLFDKPDGSKLVIGWVGESSDTLTTLYDAPPDATATSSPQAIATVRHDKQEHFDLPVMRADVFVVEDGDPPLVQAIDGGVGYSSAIGWQYLSARRQWLGMERAGVKDLPGGRARVVGVAVRRDWATGRPIPVGIGITEPWYPGLFGYRMLVTLSGPAGLDPNAEGYVVAEGTLTKTGEGYVLEADDLQRIEVPPSRGR